MYMNALSLGWNLPWCYCMMLTLYIRVPPPNYIYHRLDHSSNPLDMYIANRQRLQFPFSHRIWTFGMIVDGENYLDPNIQLCQHHAIWLLPMRECIKSLKFNLHVWIFNYPLHHLQHLLLMWFDQRCCLHHHSNHSLKLVEMRFFSACLWVLPSLLHLDRHLNYSDWMFELAFECVWIRVMDVLDYRPLHFLVVVNPVQ